MKLGYESDHGYDGVDDRLLMVSFNAAFSASNAAIRVSSGDILSVLRYTWIIFISFADDWFDAMITLLNVHSLSLWSNGVESYVLPYISSRYTWTS